MTDAEWLLRRFEENRPRLLAIAQRMLGSQTEADDAVQEVWLRISRGGSQDVENLGGWLTTIVARICLDLLRGRDRRHEVAIEHALDLATSREEDDPEAEAMHADSVGAALLIVLDSLSPAERLAYVLHDMFGVSFEELAVILDRSPAAARQLASRGRRRVRGGPSPRPVELARHQEIVSAFLGAAREGDFQALLLLLDPEVCVHADDAAVALGASRSVIGARAVAEKLVGRARAARLAVIEGTAGAVWSQQGKPLVAFVFTVVHDKVVRVDLVADPNRLAAMAIEGVAQR